MPPSRREGIVDDWHGTPVADPYRWLEDGDSPEVIGWVAAQNAATRAVLDGDPARAVWYRRLVDLMDLPQVQAAQRRGRSLFSWERPAGAQQAVLRRRPASEPGEAVTLLDPAGTSADATTSIDWFEASADGALVAVGVSDGGTEESVLRIVSGLDGSPAGATGDEIPSTRACSVAWEPDGSGFFYTRYPPGDEYHRTVHHHTRGTPWAADPVVWAEHPDPQAWPSVDLAPDGRWLLVTVGVGWSRTDVHLLDRTRTADGWTTLVAGVEATTQFVFGADGTSLVGVTTLGAPRGRVVRVDLAGGGPVADDPSGWTTLVAERDDVIKDVAVTAGGLVMTTSRAAVDALWRLDAEGRPLDRGPVGVGGVVTIDGVVATPREADWHVVVNSFGAPPALWRVSDAAAARWAPAPPDEHRLPRLAVTATTYRSPDATPIGLFLIHRDDVTPSADTPAILNGYGGFAISLGPGWQPRVAAWCAAGGLYAIAGLRGGWEHGEAWHQAGRREHKQNVFDDFAAAADHLVASGTTSRSRLAIYGGSNGGLLVGATLTQRPDLCAAAVCAVPLLDMVRYPLFRIARLWTDEYGDPDVAAEFAWVHAYSPYHHVTRGTAYPATLLQTADGDSRVDPLHARKMAALLQWAATDQARRPVLLYQEERAGHGVGKPVAKLADNLADGLTFAGSQVGLVPAP